MLDPAAEATPTIIVIAISVGEKFHNWVYTHLNEINQTIIMTASQIIRHGNADHFANSLPRNPSTIGTQSGSVCTMLRITACLTTPPTQNASKMARQQNASHFGSFGIGLSCQTRNILATDLVSKRPATHG